MKKIVRLVNHFGLLAFLIVGSLAIAAAFYFHWADPKTLEAIATIFVTAVLALVTWQYVHTTQMTLELYKEQWDYQQQVGIAFGLKKRDGKPWLRIANVGGIRVFVSKAVFRQRDKKPFTRNTVRVVKAGENYGFYIPDGVYKNETYHCDVDVTLHYQGFGKAEETTSRAFRLDMLSGRVHHVMAGVHGMWLVDCPKCDNQMAAFMIMTGLNNHDEAYKREAELKDHLAVSCPLHQSPWMDSEELIRERNKIQKEKGIEE